MARPKNVVDVLARRSRNETIYAAIIESGSIRKLAKNVGLGESTIRDVLKGRRGEIQSNTVTSQIARYYPSSAGRTKDFKAIKNELKKMPPANQKQLAVKGVVYDYKHTEEVYKLKGEDRRKAMLLKKDKKKVVEINPNQEGIAILSELYLNSSNIKFTRKG